MLVRMTVWGVTVEPKSHTPTLVLRGPVERQVLAMRIGPFEALAIARALEGVVPPRPMTHDLLRNLLETLGAKVDHIVVHGLEGTTYIAAVVLQARGHTLRIDSRPSDAVALALRADAPIYVEEAVLAQAESDGEMRDEGKALREWLDRIKPEDFA